MKRNKNLYILYWFPHLPLRACSHLGTTTRNGVRVTSCGFWVLYGLAGQYLSLEGGGCYPTPNTQLSTVRFGSRAPSFTTTCSLALIALELLVLSRNFICFRKTEAGAALWVGPRAGHQLLFLAVPVWPQSCR